ncbi:MAG: hypothetical protein E6G44_03060 [Actinobacteria bacterium]|nr:MAG: hypothetical protein E6G44_03060 [Actinomycetota bacterium]
MKFASIARAVSFLKRNLDVPVQLPADLPRGIRLDPHHGVYLVTEGGQRAAHLTLVFGKAGSLLIQYGVAQLDGCAPEDSIPVQISGQEGRLRTDGHYLDLIWPATLEHPWGTFGLSGPFSKEKILAMARSMNPAPASTATDVGC